MNMKRRARLIAYNNKFRKMLSKRNRMREKEGKGKRKYE